MNLKIRFALMFTIFAGIILFLSLTTIYVLFDNYRKSVFYDHLKNDGLQYYHSFDLSVNGDKDTHTTKLFFSELFKRKQYNERVVVLDSTGMILHSFPDSEQIAAFTTHLAKIKTKNEFLWTADDSRQYAGIFVKNTKQVIIIAGYDEPGFRQRGNLAWILFIVFMVGLLIARLISFLFVKQALLPLTQLSLQMKETNSSNLSHRLTVGKTTDEINGIAQNFNEMLERLNGAFDSKKNFVFHASHELRTPLSTMLSITESALNKDLDLAEYKETLSSLKEEQQELIELTNSLLLISQYDNLDYIRDFTKLRIDEILYETISHAKKLLPNLDIHLLFSSIPDSDDDFIINGNGTLLKSVFTNLIKNAYLYSIDQKVSVTLETDGKVIFVHFDNYGTQLPTDETDKLMTPFFRGGNALKTKGFGLGLSIVQRFITSHQGTINYTPIGENTNRFTITLNNASANSGI